MSRRAEANATKARALSERTEGEPIGRDGRQRVLAILVRANCVAAVGVLAYVGLVLFLRISGKRTLSKMSAFDLVVTVALGSTLATVLLSKDVALAEGLTAFAVLIALQYGVAWASVRSDRVRRMVKSEPALLLHRGRMLEGALRRERITPGEVYAAVRAAGRADLADVDGVVIETDGSLTVVPRGASERPSLGPVAGTGAP